MKCPKCKTADLYPTKLEQGLSGMGCNECAGVFVSLLYYRDWAERFLGASAEGEQVEDINIEDVDNTHSAMNCPKCSRMMTKYRVSSERENRLDLCAHCDEAWLDKGEWSLLKSLKLGSKMPLVFTEQWQKQVRDQVTENARRQRFKESVGADVAEEADRVREWLKAQPSRMQVLQYLTYE